MSSVVESTYIEDVEELLKEYNTNKKIHIGNYQLDTNTYSAYDYLTYIYILSETSKINEIQACEFLEKYYPKSEVNQMLRYIQNNII
ncbi:hypothetical protein [Paenibacillus taichungensis]